MGDQHFHGRVIDGGHARKVDVLKEAHPTYRFSSVSTLFIKRSTETNDGGVGLYMSDVRRTHLPRSSTSNREQKRHSCWRVLNYRTSTR